MKIEFGKLIEGIGNSLFVKEEVEKIAAERIKHCLECKHYSPNARKTGVVTVRKDAFCMDCGCNMYLKTRALSAACPLGSKTSHFPDEVPKWTAVTEDYKAAEDILETPELKKELDAYKIKLSQNKIVE
jgi:hypothetical protein